MILVASMPRASMRDTILSIARDVSFATKIALLFAYLDNFLYLCRRKEINSMTIKTTELIRTSQSWDGAQLPDFPQGQPELRVIRLDFPIGAKTGWHHHTVVNYGIVQQGDLTIVCQDGSERTFHEGEPLVEVIGTIHRGENRGKKPVVLVMFYYSEPGAEITIQHPEVHSAHGME